MSCPISKSFTTRELHSLHLSRDKNRKYLESAPFLEGMDEMPSLVFDGNAISQILRSPNFSVLSVAGEYRKLSEKTGIDLTAMVNTIDIIPLFLDGSAHKESRRIMAGILAQNRSGQQEALETAVDAVLEKHLKADGTLDLLKDLTLPMYHALTAVLVGVDWEQTFIKDDYPRVLDPILSLNRRKELNDALVEALASHVGEEISPEYAMALVMLGHDTFVGSIALGLWHVLDRHPDTPLCEMDWPKSFPVTSAPYTDRVATDDWEFEEVKIPAGGRVRLVLDAATEYGPLEKQDVVFGKGRHVCLGRVISEFGWSLMVDRLSRSNLRASTKPLEYRRPDSCFCFPESSEVKFYD